MGAVGAAKGVKDEDVSQGSQFLGEFGVVLLLFLAEAQVLHQHDLAGLQSGGHLLGVGAHHVGGHGHGDAQQLLQVLPGGVQGVLLLPLPLGTAQVRGQDDGGILLQQVADGGDGGDDAGVVQDLAGLLVIGNVKVAAHEDLLTGDINITDVLLVVIHRKKAPSLFFDVFYSWVMLS